MSLSVPMNLLMISHSIPAFHFNKHGYGYDFYINEPESQKSYSYENSVTPEGKGTENL